MKILYIAGSHKTYLDYLKERQIPRNTTAYVTSVEQVVGKRYDMLIRLDGWRKRWSDVNIDKLLASIDNWPYSK